MPLLTSAGFDVVLHDPIALDNARELLGEAPEYQPDLDQALDGADAVVVVTRWAQYTELPKRVAAMETQPLVADGRRMFAPADFDRYVGVGYPGSGA